MACFGIGTDIIRSKRLMKVYAKHGERFLKRAFHPEEIERFQSMHSNVTKEQFLSSRWAVKEATMKAFGKRILFPDISIKKAPKSTRPELHITGAARRLFDRAGVTHGYVSLSHESEYAVAFVMLESK
eukprot:123039_1